MREVSYAKYSLGTPTVPFHLNPFAEAGIGVFFVSSPSFIEEKCI